MSSFEKREGAFENKFANDQESAFRIEARTSKLFGLWAAEKMGFSGAEADAYAKEVVGSNLEEPGFDDIKRKVSGDFKAKGVDVSEHMLDSMIQKSHEDARNQIEAEKG